MVTYIYQRRAWPNFVWQDDKLAALLAAVSRKQGRLLGRMTALGLTLRAEATLQSLTEEVIKTSEQQAEPALRGLPVIVAPVMTDTTSAIAASYEARAFGIKTRTPIWEVKKKCPGLKE